MHTVSDISRPSQRHNNAAGTQLARSRTCGGHEGGNRRASQYTNVNSDGQIKETIKIDLRGIFR